MKLQTLGLATASLVFAFGLASPAFSQTTQATIAEGRCQRMLSPGQTYPGPFNVLFDTGKAVVRPADKAELQKIAGQAKTLFVTRICLIGTADKVGNAAFNKKLARDRANAVAKELAAHGVQTKYMLIDPNEEAYKEWSLGRSEDQQQDRKVVVVFAK
ncbi:MAG: OmpA family protein [Alphaproteobacteria bacterium]|jgi:outer membrane protein OmpA-like peptidoglycan-associated protein|nr:OmpA family protein [Alphaproteobacteria bacterium]